MRIWMKICVKMAVCVLIWTWICVMEMVVMVCVMVMVSAGRGDDDGAAPADLVGSGVDDADTDGSRVGVKVADRVTLAVLDEDGDRPGDTAAVTDAVAAAVRVMEGVGVMELVLDGVEAIDDDTEGVEAMDDDTEGDAATDTDGDGDGDACSTRALMREECHPARPALASTLVTVASANAAAISSSRMVVVGMSELWDEVVARVRRGRRGA